KAEAAVMALEPQADCTEMRERASAIFRTIMADHQRDQLQFDREERGRIAALVQKTRLQSHGEILPEPETRTQ
ncbi:MAG TPA: DUF922 domain-containing protein, partial [Rhizobiaceae bacterium]|nr:DUF922 domain-containing protein [Rhizobiaceae bacterium]